MRPRIRRATQRDVAFITNSWLTSFRHGKYMSRGIPNSVFFFKHHQLLDRIIPRSALLVCCDDEYPDTILGWVCAEVVDTALVIHYIYVKSGFRELGLARAMVRALVQAEKPPAIMGTHMTQKMSTILKTKEHTYADLPVVYNPYLLFEEIPHEGDLRRVQNARSRSVTREAGIPPTWDAEEEAELQ